MHDINRGVDQSGSSSQVSYAKKIKNAATVSMQVMVKRPTTRARPALASSLGALVIAKWTSGTTTSATPIDTVQSSSKIVVDMTNLLSIIRSKHIHDQPQVQEKLAKAAKGAT